MIKRNVPKLVHVGVYVAEVDVEMIYTDDEWSPYLSVSDAEKLDDVRLALRQGALVTSPTSNPPDLAQNSDLWQDQG